ncbi:MAG TPA: c-type cytochrome [Steroidobacteraceae bacterium]
MILPGAVGAASPARSEYQAAIRAVPDLEHGALLFAQCVSCHGADGQGLPDGSTPRIAGQHFNVLVKQLVDFRYGKRWDFRMEQRANTHLGAFQDIADVAGYLGQQPRKNSGIRPGNDNLAQGANLFEANCATCHGARGEGDDVAIVPMLAGQHPAYLLRQMYDSVDGRRPSLAKVHAPRIKPLDFAQLHAIADFLTSMSPPAP